MSHLLNKNSEHLAPSIRRQLEIGKEDDEQEKEANNVADKVIRMSSGNGDEETGKMKDGFEDKIRKMTDGSEGKEKLMTDGIQGTAITPLQLKCDECDEEKIQKKEENKTVASADISTRLTNNQSQGDALPEKTQEEFGSKMNADFTNVKIHTNTNAVQMNKELGAKAFTHRNNIYFNQGQYNASSQEGKHLLAHELTHTVQQKASGKIQKQQGENLTKGVTKVDKPEEKVQDVLSRFGPTVPSTGAIPEGKTHETYLQEILETDIKPQLEAVQGKNKSSYIISTPAMESVSKLAKAADLEWLGSIKMGIPNPNYNFDFQTSSKDVSAGERKPDFLYGIDQLKPKNISDALPTVINYFDTDYGWVLDDYLKSVNPANEKEEKKAVVKYEELEKNVAKNKLSSWGDLYKYVMQLNAGETRGKFKSGKLTQFVSLDRFEMDDEEFALGVFESYNLNQKMLEKLKAIAFSKTISDAIDVFLNEKRGEEKFGTKDMPFPQDENTGKENDPLYSQLASVSTKEEFEAWWNIVKGGANKEVTRPDGTTIKSSAIGTGEADANFKAPANLRAKEIMKRYYMFQTMLHEFFHFNTHLEFQLGVANEEDENVASSQRSNLLTEGVTDLFALLSWMEVEKKLSSDNALRGTIEGWWSDPTAAPKEDQVVPFNTSLVPKFYLYDETYPAFELMNKIGGLENLKAAYFLGRTDLLGSKNAQDAIKNSGLTESDEYTLHVVNESGGPYSQMLVEPAVHYGLYERVTKEEMMKTFEMKEKDYNKLVSLKSDRVIKGPDGKSDFVLWHGEFLKMKTADYEAIKNANKDRITFDDGLRWEMFFPSVKGDKAQGRTYNVIKIPNQIIPK